MSAAPLAIVVYNTEDFQNDAGDFLNYFKGTNADLIKGKFQQSIIIIKLINKATNISVLKFQSIIAVGRENEMNVKCIDGCKLTADVNTVGSNSGCDAESDTTTSFCRDAELDERVGIR